MEIIKVLLVEDNLADIRYLQEIVKGYKYCTMDVDVARSVDQALSNIKNKFYNIIILDFSLPDSDGLETLDNILECSNDIPIVVLTGNNDEQFGLSTVKKGAQDFMSKNDLTATALYKTIKYSIGRHKLIIEQRQLEMVKNEFISLVSHEVKTPLTGIKGLIELIKLKNMMPKGQVYEYFETIEREVGRVINIVNDLLDLQTIKDNQYGSCIEKINISKLIKESALVFLNSKTAIDMEFNNINEYVYGDFDKLKQVLLNLISNAIKFSKDTDSIKVRVCEDEENIRISVIDRGIGILEKDLPKLFDEFFRGSLEESRKISGTGLGLSLCKKILQMHGSKIDIETEVGKGSVFSFGLKKINSK